MRCELGTIQSKSVCWQYVWVTVKVWKHHSHSKQERFSLSLRERSLFLSSPALFPCVLCVCMCSPPTQTADGEKERFSFHSFNYRHWCFAWSSQVAPGNCARTPSRASCSSRPGPHNFPLRRRGDPERWDIWNKRTFCGSSDDGRRTALESWNFGEWEDVQWWSGGETDSACLRWMDRRKKGILCGESRQIRFRSTKEGSLHILTIDWQAWSGQDLISSVNPVRQTS